MTASDVQPFFTESSWFLSVFL